jgi:hypothetical protein
VPGVIIEADARQPVAGALVSLGLGDAACPQAEGDVLDRAQVGEQEVVLEHDADWSLLGRYEDIG